MDSSRPIDSTNQVSLLRFEADLNEFCSSPFVNKLEALLRFSGHPLQLEHGDVMKASLDCLDRRALLTDKEQAVTVALRALVETNLVEAMGYERWIDNWYETRDLYLADIPAMVRRPVAYWFVYRPTRSRFYATGYARLSDEERRTKVKKEIDALSAFIPSTGYIFGKSTPTRIDASVHGFLSANLRFPQLAPHIIEEVYRHDNLLQYHRRLTAEFWPERKQLV
ncbi:hypothetical protein PIIN_02505 [Serendipita indica DSM 11827]|uniref:Metaxin glutathione S-transferase domain-containing protein n=1 Tax=Serendipita indica (strain DSM 11827) TaxID=1109443 RepID=G4TBG5_SERID|nr:hypothetical protein PIIN_02505 [Serendipita indica DSM 11827]